MELLTEEQLVFAARDQKWTSAAAKRLMDIVVSAIALTVLGMPMLCVGIAIKLTSKGPVLHWSKRTGREGRIFWMPKFRTMHVGTPEVATRLLVNPDNYLTLIGKFLRQTSVDELPQFFSVFRGDMSLVGPRPVLLSEQDLISLRAELGVHTLFPGITGWAQVNGRDALSDEEKVRYDLEYLSQWNLLFDLRILAMTAAKVIRSENVAH